LLLGPRRKKPTEEERIKVKFKFGEEGREEPAKERERPARSDKATREGNVQNANAPEERFFARTGSKKDVL